MKVRGILPVFHRTDFGPYRSFPRLRRPCIRAHHPNGSWKDIAIHLLTQTSAQFRPTYPSSIWLQSAPLKNYLHRSLCPCSIREVGDTMRFGNHLADRTTVCAAESIRDWIATASLSRLVDIIRNFVSRLSWLSWILSASLMQCSKNAAPTEMASDLFQSINAGRAADFNNDWLL